MASFFQKLSWRVKFAFDGMRYYFPSLFDQDFWKILLKSSDAYATLPFSPQHAMKPLTEKLLVNFFHKEGFFEFPINYYGKQSLLRVWSDDTMHTEFAVLFLDLIFPYLLKEAKEKVRYEVEFLFAHAFPGMAWERNRSLFHEMYFSPKFQKTFWVCEGKYDNERNHIREDDVVFDVGANNGIFSCLAGLVVGNKGRVYAFEPLKKYADLIRKNVVLNNLRNVVVIEKALGENKGMARMDGISIVGEGGNIPVITLDAFVQENKIEKIDFLKMDVEGFERKVFLGGLNSLRNFKPRMGVCIYHLPDDPEILRNLILSINPGYRIEYNETGKKFIVY